MLDRKRILPSIALDFAAFLLCTAAAQFLLVSFDAPPWGRPADLWECALLFAGQFPILVLLLFLLDLYRIPAQRGPAAILSGVFIGISISGMVLATVLSVIPFAVASPRQAIALASGFAILLLVLFRLALPRRYGPPRKTRRALLVGANTFSVRSLQRFAREHPHVVELVGVLDDFKGDLYFDSLGIRHFGGIDALEQVLDSHRVDTLFVLNDQSAYANRIVDVLAHRTAVREVYVRMQIPLAVAQDLDLSFVQEVPLLKVYSAESGTANGLRQLADKLLAIVGMVLCLPVFVIVPLLIRLESAGPVLYRQRRLGRGNQPFGIVKFRSMVADAEQKSGAVLATKNDTRVTRIGRFLRATRIDEIPQLWNVLRGDMSIIGPRPERPEFQHAYLATIPWYALRSLCKPGVTGLAQVCGDYHTSTQRKLLYDVSYIANASPLLDLRILLATVLTVVTKRGH